MDFSRPEYNSYEQLCRELRLEREFEGGDWYYYVPTDHERIVLNVVGGSNLYTSDLDRDVSKRATERVIWLPTLSDWLEMLEAAGCRYFRFYDVAQVKRARSHLTDGWMAKTIRHAGGNTKEWCGYAPTPEEAAARLWMVVTQTPAAPAPPPDAR